MMEVVDIWEEKMDEAGYSSRVICGPILEKHRMEKRTDKPGENEESLKKELDNDFRIDMSKYTQAFGYAEHVWRCKQEEKEKEEQKERQAVPVLELGSFKPGRIGMTRTVADKLEQEEVFKFIQRHLSGNWGNLSDFDKKLNDRAVKDGDRIVSKYSTSAGDIYVITEADRSCTKVLFTSEY